MFNYFVRMIEVVLIVLMKQNDGNLMYLDKELGLVICM